MGFFQIKFNQKMKTFKQKYKYIKSQERRTEIGKGNYPELIHVLINVRSYNNRPHRKPYQKEAKEQMMLIKNGTKSWNGDVLHWFLSRYEEHATNTRMNRFYQSIFVGYARDMPF